MARETPETGRQAINRSLAENAGIFADAASQMAQGASATRAATGALKNAAIEKLLGPTAVFAGGLVAVLRTVRSIVRESGILEKGLRRIASVQSLQGKFETLLGSVTAAKKRIEELYRFTARSPFDFKDVAEANRILQALTRGAFAGTKAMDAVGDMAAATGSTMSDAAERVGKLWNALASGRSIDKTIFQLEFSGVVTQELAAKLEALEAQGATFASKWAEVEKVLGRTSGGMRNEIESLDALSTRLDNANAAMAQAFGEPFVEAQAKAMRLMIAATENLTPLVREIGQDFSIIPNFIRDAKNTLLDTVTASDRFADALRVVYKIAFSVFAGLGGATLVMAARNLTLFGQSALSTASALRVTYAAALAQSKAQAVLATATALSTAATEAFQRGSLVSAAALKLESLWLSTKTKALALNAAAATVAGAGTAAYSVRVHAANLATGALAGALGLARKGFVFLLGMVRSSVVAFATNPWTATAAAILGVAAAVYKWGTAAREAAKDARDLADAIADIDRRLTAQSAAVKSLDDWQRAVVQLRSRYSELTDEVTAFNRKVAQGEEPSRDEINANAKNVAEWKRTRTALDKELRRNTRNLDLSDSEKEFIRTDQAERRAATDRDFRIAYGAAETPEQRLALLDGRRAELEKRIEAGRLAKAGELEALRNGSAAERAQLEVARDEIAARYAQREQALIDRRDRMMEERGAKRNAQGGWDGVPVTAEARDIFNETEKQLRALRAERGVKLDDAETKIRDLALFSKSPTVRAQAELDEAVRTGAGPARIEELTRKLEDARAAVAGLADAENELAEITATVAQETRDNARALAMSTTENMFDAFISEAKRTGRPTRGIEFDKAVALAEVERTNARTPEEVQAAQNKIAAIEAERAAGVRGVIAERAKSEALNRRDFQTAQAIDDALALQEKIDQYAGLGLSEEQARADFAAGLSADAQRESPTIVADSMQRIGAGGGAYTGADPALRAAERTARAAEEQKRLLERIASALGSGPPPDPYTN